MSVHATLLVKSLHEPSNDAPVVDKEMFLESQLCLALYKTTNTITRAYSKRLKSFGITYPQFLCLLALWEQSPRTVSNVGDALDLGKGTITPLLMRLEEQGLIVRLRDIYDERRVNVHLTDEGRALRTPIMLARRELVCSVAVTAQEVDLLKLQLNELRGKLEQAA